VGVLVGVEGALVGADLHVPPVKVGVHPYAQSCCIKLEQYAVVGAFVGVLVGVEGGLVDVGQTLHDPPAVLAVHPQRQSRIIADEQYGAVVGVEGGLVDVGVFIGVDVTDT